MSDIENVKKLREATGAGFKDCNLAIKESGGDIDKAIEILRVKGISKASKKMSRDAKEGVVAISGNEKKTSIIEVNCETDFVAKNESFVDFAKSICSIALSCSTIDDLLSSNFESMTIKEKLIEQTGVIGEKLEIGSFEVINSEFVGFYIHAGNKIASLVGLSNKFESSEEVSKNISMQVAAMNPIALNEENVSKEVIEKEIEIAKEQLRAEGKPEAMLDNIAKGKLKKFFKDNTLIKQSYIKDNKLSIENYIESEDKDCAITAFKRVALV